MSEVTLFVGKGDSPYMTELAKREEAMGAIAGQSEIQILQQLRAQHTNPESVIAIGGSIRSKGCLVQLILSCLDQGIQTTVDLERSFIDPKDTGAYANIGKRKAALAKELGNKIHDPKLIITPQ